MIPTVFAPDPSFINKFKNREFKLNICIDSISPILQDAVNVFIQIEPPSVRDIRDQVIKNNSKFDLILAWDERILVECHNSKLFILGDCWIDFNSYKNDKQNQISFITSSKSWAPGHILRHYIFDYLTHYEYLSGFDIKAIRTPPRIENKHEIFENAKFSIVVENEQCNNWITEKFIDCVATETVPIYYGAPNIGNYFNTDSILTFNNLNELVTIISNLSPYTYSNMKKSIKENRHIAKKYFNLIDRIEKEIDKL